MTTRLEKFYKDTVVPQLMKEFGYENIMQVTRITKIALNMGVGEAVGNKKILENAVADMAKIAGQKPVTTKARVSVASFKIRDGWPIGCKVTLQPIGQPSRILNEATEMRDLVTSGFWPLILAMSATAFSRIFLFAAASPTPMLSVILESFGTSIGLV